LNAPAKICLPFRFDAARLDRLMDEAGMDVLIATSKHNVQYLLAATAPSSLTTWMRWGSAAIAVMVYAKGAPDKAANFGTGCENFQRENHPFWTPVQQCNSSGSVDTMQKAIEHIRKSGIKPPAGRRAVVPAGRCRQGPAGRILRHADQGQPVRSRTHAARSRHRTS